MILEVLRLVQLFLKCLNCVSWTNLKVFFSTEDNQFGFKKGLGCTHAIYTVQNIVNKYVSEGSTAICALDLNKAFDKTNHHALFIIDR